MPFHHSHRFEGIHRIPGNLTSIALLSFLTLGAACGSGSVAPIATTGYTLVQAADSVPLPYGSDVRIGDVWMTLTAVPADSRCPINVQCVWAGDATVELSVRPGCYMAGCEASSAAVVLHTNLQPRAARALGYQVQLLSLLPEPVYNMQLNPSRYVAWVRVSR